MKKVVIILVLAFVLALTLSLIPYFAENEVELLEFDIDEARLAESTSDVAPGMFCGTLNPLNPDTFELAAVDEDGIPVCPVREVVTDGDREVFRFALDAFTGLNNFGNYYGIMGKVEPNTTYTARMTYKCNPGMDLGEEARIAKIILGYASKDGDGIEGASRANRVLLTLNTEEYVTTELVFTTDDWVGQACLIIGPNGFLARAAAGYELLISNLELYEGDVSTPTVTPEPTPTPAPPEGGAVELLGFDIDETRLAENTWNVEEGMFCGTLNALNPETFELAAVDEDGTPVCPVREIITDGGREVYRFALDAFTGLDNFGNYYGIMEEVEPNTTYTARVTYKCNPGMDLGEEARIAKIVFGYANKAGDGIEGAAREDRVLLTLNTEDYVTTELVFTTDDYVEQACLVIGPNGFLARAAAGYELLIADLELYEGTVIPPVRERPTPAPTPDSTATPEPTATPTPTAEPTATPEATTAPTDEPKNTNSCGSVVASSCAVIVLTLLGAAWVIRKKH